MPQLAGLVERSGLDKGRIDIALDPTERHVGLTVNEYETLLMRYDLADVLRDPLRLVAKQGMHMLSDPMAIPSKTMGYAKYDLVQVFNELMDAFRVSESVVEKILASFIRVPAARFLRMKRSISFLVSDSEDRRRGRIVQGTYQSPILVQWQRADHQVRRLDTSRSHDSNEPDLSQVNDAAPHRRVQTPVIRNARSTPCQSHRLPPAHNNLRHRCPSEL
ncbi:MAG: hypothetical protein HYT85_08280 [candidate division NC10 bacterium]|nr:hypothetical protein [candidate division NC10 bacterium]